MVRRRGVGTTRVGKAGAVSSALSTTAVGSPRAPRSGMPLTSLPMPPLPLPPLPSLLPFPPPPIPAGATTATVAASATAATAPASVRVAPPPSAAGPTRPPRVAAPARGGAVRGARRPSHPGGGATVAGAAAATLDRCVTGAPTAPAAPAATVAAVLAAVVADRQATREGGLGMEGKGGEGGYTKRYQASTPPRPQTDPQTQKKKRVSVAPTPPPQYAQYTADPRRHLYSHRQTVQPKRYDQREGGARGGQTRGGTFSQLQLQQRVGGGLRHTTPARSPSGCATAGRPESE